jgi:hypothetical protein
MIYLLRDVFGQQGAEPDLAVLQFRMANSASISVPFIG